MMSLLEAPPITASDGLCPAVCPGGLGQHDYALMPQLCRATCPEVASRLLTRYLPDLDFDGPAGIRVEQYHAGQFCAVAYRLSAAAPFGLVGELYSTQRGESLLDLQQNLWQNGFGPWAADRIQVTRPLTYIPEMQMLVHSRVPGRPWAAMLTPATLEPLARRYAEFIAKLHAIPLPEVAVHLETRTPASELAEMTLALVRAAAAYAAPSAALTAVEAGLRRWAAHPPSSLVTPALIYSDPRSQHILIAGSRLILTSLESLALGDPALDVAYFHAHLIGLGLAGVLELEACLAAAFAFGEEYTRRRLVGVRFWRRVAFYEAVAYLRLLGEKPQPTRPADFVASVVQRAAQCLEMA